MTWPRLTTRKIMTLVLILAVLLGLAIPAVRVHSDRSGHMHRWVTQANGKVMMISSGNFTSAFWPRYGNCLLGRSWRRLPVCATGEVFYAEICEFEHPDSMVEIAPGIRSMQVTSDQKLAQEHLKTALNQRIGSLPAPLGPRF